ncbi:hypothetical protein M513_08029, partial [Trichuris suis]
MSREKNHPNKVVPLKLWLKWAADTGRGMKLAKQRQVLLELLGVRINLYNSNVVIPALRYLESRRKHLSQITVHADVFRDQYGEDTSMEAETFVRSTSELLPSAIISVGWTWPAKIVPDNRHYCPDKYTWRKVLDMLRVVYDAPQTVIFSFYLPCALVSLEEINWLLLARPNSYVTFVDEFRERLFSRDDLEAIIQIQRFGFHYNASRPARQSKMLRSGPLFNYAIQEPLRQQCSSFLEEWQLVNFMHPKRDFSRIIHAGDDVALLGWTSGYVRHVAPKSSVEMDWQSLTGRLVFVTDGQERSRNSKKGTGLVIRIANASYFPTSPVVRGDVAAYIGGSGYVYIENEPVSGQKRASNGQAVVMTTVTLPMADCYDFEMTDREANVELVIYQMDCNESPPSRWSIWWPWIRSNYVRLTLPKFSASKRPRSLYIQKKGDSSVDLLVRHLHYSSEAYLVTSSRFVTLCALVVICAVAVWPLFNAFTWCECFARYLFIAQLLTTLLMSSNSVWKKSKLVSAVGNGIGVPRQAIRFFLTSCSLLKNESAALHLLEPATTRCYKCPESRAEFEDRVIVRQRGSVLLINAIMLWPSEETLLNRWQSLPFIGTCSFCALIMCAISTEVPLSVNQNASYGDLAEKYRWAVKFLKEKEGKAFHLAYDTRVRLAALSKQVSCGPYTDDSVGCEVGFLDRFGHDRKLGNRSVFHKKRIAYYHSTSWRLLGSMEREKAMQQFIVELEELCPELSAFYDVEKREQVARLVRLGLQQEPSAQQVREALNRENFEQFSQYAAEQYPNEPDKVGAFGISILIASSVRLRLTDSEQVLGLQFGLGSHSQVCVAVWQGRRQIHGYIGVNGRRRDLNFQGNREALIKQLQDSHFEEYMAQVFNGRTGGGSVPLDSGEEVVDDNAQTVTPVSSGLDTSQLIVSDASSQEQLVTIQPASMWTRRDIREFKEAIKQEENGVIKVGYGETVTVRVPTHENGSCIFWEFATDKYDIAFGLLFEWTVSDTSGVSVHVSEMDDEEDEFDDENSSQADLERGYARDSPMATKPQVDQIIPVYRRDCYEEVFAGSHVYPGKGVYLLKFDNSYSLWRSKTLYYRVYYSK